MNSEKKSTYITFAVIAGIVLIAVIFTIWRVHSKPAVSTGASVNQSAIAPLFVGTYTDFDGTIVDLRDYDDRVRVVNAWATWCPFCTHEIADFIELSKQYDPEEVVIILINRKENISTVRSYLQSIAITDYGNVLFLQDAEDAFYSTIGGFTMPETVIYTTNDNVSQHKRGFMNRTEMKLFIDAARSK